jgi:ribonuclease HI
MMERRNGAMEWSKSHSSPFETTKLAVMHFSPTAAKHANVGPLKITDENGDEFEVERAENYKYLGVIINDRLSWKPHTGLVQSRAIKWTNLFCRLMRTSRGLAYPSARRIYNAVAAARINYACDVWYSPIYKPGESKRRKGSVGIAKKLTSIQRKAAIAISGALRSTAADAAEIHAGLPPVEHRLSRLCALAATRAATLPKSHPLHLTVRRKAAQRPVKRHRTTLQTLLHLNETDPTRMEKIRPSRRPPNFKPRHTTQVPPSKEDAKELDKRIENTGVRIYSDGSGYRGRIGASAVLYENGVRKKTVKYSLGPDTEYTVFEGEAIGALMGIHLANQSTLARSGTVPVSISLDNQALIASLNNQKPRPSHTIIDWIHDAVEGANEDVAEALEFIWVPGHRGSRGNEAADEAAKKAAEGETSSRKDLPKNIRKLKEIPVSSAAVKQRLTKDMDRDWTRDWIKSPRYRRFRRFEKKNRGSRYEKLAGRLRRNQMSALTQLRTNHIPLNFYLHRIKRAESADCPHCPGMIEDVDHLLFTCNNYAHARQALRDKLGRKASSSRHLLSTEEGTKSLMRYLQQTKRFERSLGTLWKREDEEGQEDEEA